MSLEKPLNGQFIGKWILIVILANKLKSYYLAEKQVPNHTHHWILVTSRSPSSEALRFVFRCKIKFWWAYSMRLNLNTQNSRIDQKAATNHAESSIVNNL